MPSVGKKPAMQSVAAVLMAASTNRTDPLQRGCFAPSWSKAGVLWDPPALDDSLKWSESSDDWLVRCLVLFPAL